MVLSTTVSHTHKTLDGILGRGRPGATTKRKAEEDSRLNSRGVREAGGFAVQRPRGLFTVRRRIIRPSGLADRSPPSSATHPLRGHKESL